MHFSFSEPQHRPNEHLCFLPLFEKSTMGAFYWEVDFCLELSDEK